MDIFALIQEFNYMPKDENPYTYLPNYIVTVTKSRDVMEGMN